MTSEDLMDVDISSADIPSVEEVFTDSSRANTDDLVVTNRRASTDADAPVTTDAEDPVTPNTDSPVTVNTDSLTANTDSPVITNTGNPVTTDADDPTSTNVNDSATDAEDSTIASSKDPTTMGTEHSTIAHSAFSPASLGDIDEASVPVFLLRHGKGKREVNIFGYLSEVKNPRFQQILFHYLCFEINNKSMAAGSLPTIKRPVEIGQWSSRARPASLPEYTKGGRSLTHFADSVFEWWTCIQPPWRKFKRGQVSREVRGEWDALCATGINGLLNVVVLAYWWIRILEEDKPGDSMPAEYELFAEDVAWVFSNLASTHI